MTAMSMPRLAALRPQDLNAVHGLVPELLETVRSAARDCRRSFRVLRALEAGPDHPRAGDGDVGRYLAGWLLAVDPDEELT